MDDHVLQVEGDWDLRGVQGMWEELFRRVESNPRFLPTGAKAVLASVVGGPVDIVQGSLRDLIDFHERVLADEDGSLQDLATLLDDLLGPFNPFLKEVCQKFTGVW